MMKKVCMFLCTCLVWVSFSSCDDTSLETNNHESDHELGSDTRAKSYKYGYDYVENGSGGHTYKFRYLFYKDQYDRDVLRYMYVYKVRSNGSLDLQSSLFFAYKDTHGKPLLSWFRRRDKNGNTEKTYYVNHVHTGKVTMDTDINTRYTVTYKSSRVEVDFKDNRYTKGRKYFKVVHVQDHDKYDTRIVVEIMDSQRAGFTEGKLVRYLYYNNDSRFSNGILKEEKVRYRINNKDKMKVDYYYDYTDSTEFDKIMKKTSSSSNKKWLKEPVRKYRYWESRCAKNSNMDPLDPLSLFNLLDIWKYSNKSFPEAFKYELSSSDDKRFKCYPDYY